MVKTYIAFEGLVGCGKSTIMKMTSEWLKGKDFKVNLMEEPGDAVRGILGTYGIDDRIDTLLFVADRLIQQKKIAGLPDNIILLSERCFLSTIAFQQSILPGNLLDMHNMHYKIEDIDMILDSETLIFPDIAIILDVDVQEGLNRKKEKFEKWETSDYLPKVKEKYQQMTIDKKYPFDIFMVDANHSIEETFEHVKKIIKSALKI